MAETAQDIIEAIQTDVESAADTILSATETCLRELSAAPESAQAELSGLQAALCAILEACSFQDLAGQRLAKLKTLLSQDTTVAEDHRFLNGPALHGKGLDQGQADALMNADGAR